MDKILGSIQHSLYFWFKVLRPMFAGAIPQRIP